MSNLLGKIQNIISEENTEKSEAQVFQDNKCNRTREKLLRWFDEHGKKLFNDVLDEQTVLDVLSSGKDFSDGFKAAFKIIFEALV